VRRLELPDGGSFLYACETDGHLVPERDPLGVVTRWSRSAVANGYAVTTRESSGATRTWTRTRYGAQTTVTVRGPDGLTTREVATGDARTVTWPDGSELRARLGRDPRWADQLSEPREITLATPTPRRYEADGAPASPAVPPTRSLRLRSRIGGRPATRPTRARGLQLGAR
jgi:hypothetical protein